MNAISEAPMPMPPPYVCPKCKGELQELHCAHCDVAYISIDGIPCFLDSDAQTTDHELRKTYDDIYRHHTDVWIDQGRSDQFQQYFAGLAREANPIRTLEIGCGEGTLLATLPGTSKFGIDPSIQALLRARERSLANCAVARCEQLPFPPNTFDAIVAVGVMEHFEFVDAAIAEIARVLSPTGLYIALIQTDMTLIDRVILKFRRYVFPNFRPLALAGWIWKWIKKKTAHPIVQPMRKSYTIDSARKCLQQQGLHVFRTITQSTAPTAPLAGPHVVILIAGRKPL